ncbi:MAG: RNA polymerase-binding protein RbpA [Demequina sp.]
MAGGNAIRGSRVGAGPMGEDERGESAPRQVVNYYCAKGHVTSPSFALGDENDAPEVPMEWDCPRCGLPGGLDPENPPEPLRNEPYKTHLAYVKERRTDEEGEALLDEALGTLRARRGTAVVAD